MPVLLANLSVTGHLNPVSRMILKYKSRSSTIFTKTTTALPRTFNSTVNLLESRFNLSTIFKMRFSSFTLPSIALLLTVAAAAPAPADPTSIAPVETPAANSTAPAPVDGEDDGKMGIMNFAQTCGACYMDGARLICKCTSKSNTHRWTEVDLAERIGNSRGTLVYNS